MHGKHHTKAAKEAYMKKMKKDKYEKSMKKGMGYGKKDDRNKPGKAYTKGKKGYGMRKKESMGYKNHSY